MVSDTRANLTHADIIANHPELVARQLAVEDEANNIAKEAVAAARRDKGITEGSPTVRQRFAGLVIQTADAIDAWIDAQAKVKRKPTGLKHIQLITSDEAAYLTLRVVLNRLASGNIEAAKRYTGMCVKVGSKVQESVEYAMFLSANPGLAHDLERQLKHTQHEGHRRAVLRAGYRSADFEGLSWTEKELAAIGMALVESAAAATGLFRREVDTSRKSRSASLMPTPAFVELLSRAEERDSLLCPFYLPMVIPPKPWTDVYTGGYLNDDRTRLELVRSRKGAAKQAVNSADLADVLDSVNAIQAVPWQINADVLNVMRLLHLRGDGAANLAGSETPALPDRPWDTELSPEEFTAWRAEGDNEAVFKAWKAEARDGHTQRTRWLSHRLVQQQQLELAERFKDELMYFPHSLDFRGRIYPAAGCGAINPQGNDAGKALLHFGRAKRLGSEGRDWLFFHTANCWGIDKAAMTDRQVWTYANLDVLASYAADPLGNTGWMDADKPFGFLAACFEVAGWMREGDDWMTRLPIAVDGSCSGLQHFGAMMRCPTTADAVNLRQTGDTPADVYTKVLDALRKRIEGLLDSDCDDTRGMAEEWETRLSRLIVKQPVMTTPYGVTHRGINKQIAENFGKLVGKGKVEPFERCSTMEAANWLGPLVAGAISTEVAAATIAMEWLTAVAAVTAAANLPIYWQTPVGFLVIQDYRKTSGRRLDIKWAGERITLQLSTDTDVVRADRQCSGMAPNFVHSMDAAHLMVTVNNCVEYGIHDFAMIHDSYGCHAGDVGTLQAILRESFIAMYEGDTLRGLYDQLREQVPAEVFSEIPPPPVQGSLDLACVRDSEYFFA